MRPSRLGFALLLMPTPHAAMAALPRFPQPDGDRIIFVADGNIWAVQKAGGTAHKLTSGAGQDMFPRVSPDGKWIAYTHADLQGTSVFVIPAAGGTARQLTYRPATEMGTGGRHGPDNMVVTWSPDSQNVIYLSKGDAWNGWLQYLYEVPVSGGLPIPMAIDSAVGLLTYSPDGHTIAYNRIFRNFRTWKRYNGGLAQQVYTYDFNTRKLTQITHWSGTNTSPMWSDNKIYYLSDRDAARRANIWVYDFSTGKSREITHFKDYDIDFPGLGPGGIAFQQGGKLWMLDLPSEALREVPLTVPDDGTRTTPTVRDVSTEIRATDMAQQVDYALSPNGQRTLLSARGDIFSIPTKFGATRDLTNTQTADEDHPTWSPDGRTIYYTTDVSGEQEIAARPAQGGDETLLTHFKTGYFYQPLVSPDSKLLAFSDNAHRLWLIASSGAAQPILVAQDQISEIHDASFSPDSRWLALSISSISNRRDIYLYEISTKKLTRLGPGGGIDSNPIWSADGKYLFFNSARHENTVLSDIEFDFAVLNSTGIYAIPLAKDTSSPVAPRSDEGAIATGPAPVEKPLDDRTKSAKPVHAKSTASNGRTPIRIDRGGIMDRAVLLPVSGAEISQMDTRDHRIFYDVLGIQEISGQLPHEKSELHVFDLKTRKDSVIADDIQNFSLSADGQKILVHQEKNWEVLDTNPGSNNKQPLQLGAMKMVVDPRTEWAEMFNNAWRLERDFFVSKVMNGINWQEIHDVYAKFLPWLGSRDDLNYLIGQIQGELGNSHTYVGGGDDGEQGKPLIEGVLGVDFASDPASGRYRMATIYPGDNTRAGYRSPLSEPGLDIHPGDYLLAVDGQMLKMPTNPYALFRTIAPDSTTELTVADTANGKPRVIRVKPIANELSVREAAHIAHNRAIVDQLSHGRIGYIYLSDMEQLGLQQFVRQFYEQLTKEAVIVDDRWNGGGFVAPLVLERLRRILVELGSNRERATLTEPQQLISGPKICLVNHWSASDGDIFPDLFRRYGLGKLVGTRSWGGVRGIRGEWTMMDGGYITIPEDTIYTLQGQWDVENHGVDPDVMVEDTPAELLAGHDTQLETAVRILMEQIGPTPRRLAPPPPLLPPYPANGMVKPQP